MVRNEGTQAFICNPIKPIASHPDHEVLFHKLLPLRVFSIEVGDQDPEDPPDIQGSFVTLLQEDGLKLGSASIARGNLRFFAALDLIYRQSWCLDEMFLGDIDTTLSLAPAEEQTLRIRRTQREKLERTHVDQREAVLSFENSIQDKEVVSATRSSAKQLNWHINGKSNISLGVMGKGVKFGSDTMIDTGLALQVNEANKSTTEQVHDVTTRSSRQLTMMSKVEVTSTSELTLEEESFRKLTNPYRDRSLDLNIFQIFKRFEVSTSFDPADIVPALVLEFEAFTFDNSFVRNNINFLREHLLEDELLEEYLILLRENVDDLAHRYERETQTRAEIAMEYLFSRHNVTGFVFEDTPEPFTLQTIEQSYATRIGPAGAFLEWNRSALEQTLEEAHATELYLTLNFFYRIYKDIHSGTNSITYPVLADGVIGLPSDNGDVNLRTINLGTTDDRKNFVVDLAVTLAETLQVQLGKLSPESLQNLANVNHSTEWLRTALAFPALMVGIVVPKQQEEEEKVITSRRFGALETRIARHLKDYESHYTQRYLEYITQRTRNSELLKFLDSIIGLLSIGELSAVENLTLQFDLETAFVDRNRLIVPRLGEGGISGAIEVFSGDGFGIAELEELDLPRVEVSTNEIVLPHDGVHIEPAHGICQLDGVPDKDCTGEASFEFSCGPKDA